MASRSYLYASSNRPKHYADRPDVISGLSEWPYVVPLVYYILVSGNPTLCGSLISDGLDDDEEDKPTRLFALSGDFDAGLARFERFSRLARRLAPSDSTYLRRELDEARSFLTANRNRYLHLETVELDTMLSDEASGLRRLAETHLAAARAAGAAVDALSRFDFLAARQLRRATASGEGPFAPFKGLSLTDECDHRNTRRALGIGGWTDSLYFTLQNRQQFYRQ